MQILMTHEAKAVVVCNIDEKPSYSGVENTLYEMYNTVKLFGNAKETLGALIGVLWATENHLS